MSVWRFRIIRMAYRGKAIIGANLGLLIYGAASVLPVECVRAQPKPPVFLSTSFCDRMDVLNCDVAKRFSHDFTMQNWGSIEKYIDERSTINYKNGKNDFSSQSGLKGIKDSSRIIYSEFRDIRLISCQFITKLEPDKFILVCEFSLNDAKAARDGKKQMQIALSVREQGIIDYVGFSFPKIMKTATDTP